MKYLAILIVSLLSWSLPTPFNSFAHALANPGGGSLEGELDFSCESEISEDDEAYDYHITITQTQAIIAMIIPTGISQPVIIDLEHNIGIAALRTHNPVALVAEMDEDSANPVPADYVRIVTESGFQLILDDHVEGVYLGTLRYDLEGTTFHLSCSLEPSNSTM